MKKNIFILLLGILSYANMNVYGQIFIDKSLKLTGTSSGDKQIENLSGPDSLNHIATATSIQKNTGRFGVAFGTDSLIITIPNGIRYYSPGNIFYFQASAYNTGPVKISINNLPYHSLKIFGNEELKVNQLKKSQIYCVIFSGNEFQLLSPINEECLPGFVEGNKTYCIEANENAASDLWQAMKTCNDNNTRLCKWGEWYYACQKGITGLVNMTNNNWEWTDDAANHTVRVAGSTNCKGLSNGPLAGPYPFRCCYSK